MPRRRPRRSLLRAALATIATLTSLTGAAAAARADTPTGDPSANRSLSQSTLDACAADPNGAACVDAALADIDAARAAEGVSPMHLPVGFATMGGAQQLLVLADLERVDRNLLPVLGLAAPLNADAAAAAASDQDPEPSVFSGTAWSSNWAGGYPSTLETEFAWMYDDGPGSGNLDCQVAGDPGCWGHREDTLMRFDAPLVMGAAVGTGAYGPSLAEVFVGGDRAAGPGGRDAPLAPTWAQITGTATSTSIASGGPTPTSGPAPAAAPRRIGLQPLPSSVRSGRTVRITGSVTAPLDGRRIVLQRWTRRGWTTLGATLAAPRFDFRLRATGRGVLHLRVAMPGSGAAVRLLTLHITP